MRQEKTHGPLADARRFGQEALGPILAEFCMRLWLQQRFLADPQDATLLFCARGGLRLRLVYERFLERTGLPPILACESLMVSRLVAARAAAVKPGAGLLSELGREFEGRPMSEVAEALAQRGDLPLAAEWQAPFRPERFVQLLSAADAGATALRAEIAAQDTLFREHLAGLMQGRSGAILCDTGLYGSTVRLLREAMPEKRWLCLQFARSNYKRLATPHFDCTRGLSVESDHYKPWRIETSALRFWQLIEAALEPPLPSVTNFTRPAPGAPPRSDLEIEGWQALLAPEQDGLFAGVLAYLDTLDHTAPALIGPRARRGWRRFRRAVIWPDAAAVMALSLEDRSRDFGRTERVAQFAAAPGSERTYARIRSSLWREGATRRFFPRLGRLGLVAIELTYAARAIGAALSGRRRRRARQRPAPEPIGEPAGSHP